VLIGGEGKEDHAYLTDFGFTKRGGLGVPVDPRGPLPGHATCAAREQIEEGKVGPRSDAYSLGGVLFEALTGYVPFPASDVHDALLAHLSLQAPTATEVALGCRPISTP